MPVSDNAYMSPDASSDGVIPNLYNTTAEKYLYDAEKLRPLCLDMSGMIRGKPGKSFDTFKGTEFTVGELTEGVDTPVSPLDFNKVQLTVKWYGDAKQITKENLAYSFRFVLNDLRYGAAGALGTNRDAVIMTEMLRTSKDAIYPLVEDTSPSARYTASTITSEGQLSYEQITVAETEMLVDNRELQWIVIHPRQKYSLMNDENFIDNNKFPQNVIMNGQIGKISSATIIVSNAVQSTVENSTTVYQAVALARRAIMYAQKVDPVFEFDEETKRSRALTFHYYEAFGTKILHTEGIIPLKGAGRVI